MHIMAAYVREKKLEGERQKRKSISKSSLASLEMPPFHDKLLQTPPDTDVERGCN